MSSTENKHRPMFLFGSYTSPMPKVPAITKAVLDGTYYFDWSHPYHIRRDTKHLHPKAYCIQTFLKHLRKDVAQYSCIDKMDVNYEELAFIVDQLAKEGGTNRNPAIGPFFKSYRKVAIAFDEYETLTHLASDAMKWIKWVVFNELFDSAPKAQRLSTEHTIYPQSLATFFNRLGLEKRAAHICTLNHDLKTEDALESQNIAYTDGFVLKSDNDEFPSFHPQEALTPEEEKNTLLKLHGSINWFWQFPSEYHSLSNPRIDCESEVIQGDARTAYRYRTEPAFIAGSINKLEDYTYQIYPWIWAAFQNQLLDTKRIICSGYGFMDLGVTSRLYGWLTTLPSNKLLIIDPTPKALVERCKRHAISNISGFFRDDTYTICSDANDIEKASTPIIILECEFEALNESNHFPSLRKFSYH